MIKLDKFDFKIYYKKGKLNISADALSRIPNISATTEPSIFGYMEKFSQKLSQVDQDDNRSIATTAPEENDQNVLEINEKNDGATIHSKPKKKHHRLYQYRKIS